MLSQSEQSRHQWVSLLSAFPPAEFQGPSHSRLPTNVLKDGCRIASQKGGFNTNQACGEGPSSWLCAKSKRTRPLRQSTTHCPGVIVCSNLHNVYNPAHVDQASWKASWQSQTVPSSGPTCSWRSTHNISHNDASDPSRRLLTDPL